MKAQPIEYESVLHYPIQKVMCDGCVHYTAHGSAKCNAFMRFVKENTGLNSSCSPGGPGTDVIWQVGDVARLQYITERLTT